MIAECCRLGDAWRIGAVWSRCAVLFDQVAVLAFTPNLTMHFSWGFVGKAPRSIRLQLLASLIGGILDEMAAAIAARNCRGGLSNELLIDYRE